MHKRMSPNGDFDHMGDASVTTEKEIMNKYNLSDIDVLYDEYKNSIIQDDSIKKDKLKCQ